MHLPARQQQGNYCRKNINENNATQKVFELPSTAMLAPCAAASAELLDVMAPCAAASSTPAATPLWLKQKFPARPNFNWPAQPAQNNFTRTKVTSMMIHRCPAFPMCLHCRNQSAPQCPLLPPSISCPQHSQSDHLTSAA